MTSLARVVWQEGMHLSQHHFQAQERYVEELISFARTCLHFEPWGVASYELDAEALRNDTVSLVSARGIMPDGLAFAFPEDPPPEPLHVRDLFSPTQDSHLVLLGIPAYREGAANAAREDAGPLGPRFEPLLLPMTDEVTGGDVKPVAVGRKRFRLLLDSQEGEGLVTLPIARIRRDGAGHFQYDPDYVPPCVRIGASPRLMRLVREVAEMVAGRIESLTAERAAAPGEVAGHWLAHALHAALGPLLHHGRTTEAHPSDLFVELSRLAGALTTFTLESGPQDLPLYDHRDPGSSFGALERRLRDALGVAVPVGSLRFELEKADEAFYGATIADPRCYAGGQWYLGVRSSLLPTELARGVRALVKVCSAKHIRRLVVEALPGLDLEHVPAPPPQIGPRPGTEYFVIRRSGACWTSISQTRQIGVYAPAALTDAELEIVVALDPG